MRRLLKSKILGNSLGDLSSLENPQILNEIQKLIKNRKILNPLFTIIIR